MTGVQTCALPIYDISISDSRIRDEINYLLATELEDLLLSPEAGIQKIRKVLQKFGYDMPVIYEANVDGDEYVLSIDSIDTQTEVSDYFLYVIYYLTDDSNYEFYAEVTDDNGIDEILSEDDEEENL